MGKLRVVPKTKAFDPNRYKELAEILTNAHRAADDARVFWDLDPNEDGNKTRRELLYVAEQEGINLTVRRQKGQSTLQLLFKDEVIKRRMSAKEGRQRILSAFNGSEQPMKKADILAISKVSSATWNLRIRELTESSTVIRKGTRRDTTYFLADS